MVSLQELWDKLELLEDELDSKRGDTRIAIEAPISNGVVISQPGSYYLVQPISHTASATPGIRITSPGVTLDLNGCYVSYSQFAAGGAASSAPAIEITAAAERVRIEGGSLVGFAKAVDAPDTKNATLRDIAVAFCNDGIELGEAATVVNCRFEPDAEPTNGFTGIRTGTDSQILRCRVSAVSAAGDFTAIRCGARSKIEGCLASGNTGATTRGIHAEEQCAIHQCIASENQGIAGDCIGISVSRDAQITSCTASGNQSLAGTATGIVASETTAVRFCTASNNSGTGISAGAHCAITNNCVAENGTLGIRATFRNTITGNQILGRVSAFPFASPVSDGISAESSRNTIDSNSFTSCSTAIDSDSSSNVIVRNTFANVTFPFGFDEQSNTHGPLVRADALIPANDANAENPWANISE